MRLGRPRHVGEMSRHPFRQTVRTIPNPVPTRSSDAGSGVGFDAKSNVTPPKGRDSASVTSAVAVPAQF